MMRSPKLGGFSNFKFKKTYEPVNVGALNAFDDGATVTAAELWGLGLIHGPQYKILGDGDLTRSLTVHAPSFSRSAASKIEAAGGRAVTESDQAAARDSGGQS
jgi:large subunit ribosomal protein L15